jgi:hypothetical protein
MKYFFMNELLRLIYYKQTCDMKTHLLQTYVKQLRHVYNKRIHRHWLHNHVYIHLRLRLSSSKISKKTLEKAEGAIKNRQSKNHRQRWVHKAQKEDNQYTVEYKCEQPGDRFTKVIVNRKSKITFKISLRARIRAFH